MGFNVKLSIEDDRELRAAIKDMIKGEIMSIARGEIKNILAQALADSVLPKDQADIDRLVQAEIVRQIKAIMEERNGMWGDGATTIRQYIRDAVNAYIRQFFKTNATPV